MGQSQSQSENTTPNATDDETGQSQLPRATREKEIGQPQSQRDTTTPINTKEETSQAQWRNPIAKPTPQATIGKPSVQIEIGGPSVQNVITKTSGAKAVPKLSQSENTALYYATYDKLGQPQLGCETREKEIRHTQSQRDTSTPINTKGETSQAQWPNAIAKPTPQAKIGKPSVQNEISRPSVQNVISKTSGAKAVPKLSHNYENIIKDADAPLNFSSTEKLYDHLYSGVFLSQKTKKYWIEKETGYNCFMLYARDLQITWAEENGYWLWNSLPETSDVNIDVAELMNVCWLEVHGKFNTTNLSLKTTYEVSFIVMFKDLAYGWEVPVNIRLILPDGEKKERKEALETKPKAQWIELKAGEFYTSPDKQGELQFSLFEYEGGNWKRGLVIKGVVIRPKKNFK